MWGWLHGPENSAINTGNYVHSGQDCNYLESGANVKVDADFGFQEKATALRKNCHKVMLNDCLLSLLSN